MTHPRTTTPGAPDTRIVRCPDCGQMEVWTDREMEDHGQCRLTPEGTPCEACD